MKIWLTLLLAVLTLSGCAGTPTNTDNVCAVFDQRGGWFNNWYKYAKSAEKEYGVPVPVLMATIYKESGFNAKAKPPRTKLLGFIPWKRPSSAYGYPQALDGTWDEYREDSGNRRARRTNIRDASDFIGWYMNLTVERNGVPLTDARNQHLAYHEGHAGFRRGSYNAKPWLLRVADRVEDRAETYRLQLATCTR